MRYRLHKPSVYRYVISGMISMIMSKYLRMNTSREINGNDVETRKDELIFLDCNNIRYSVSRIGCNLWIDSSIQNVLNRMIKYGSKYLSMISNLISLIMSVSMRMNIG